MAGTQGWCNYWAWTTRVQLASEHKLLKLAGALANTGKHRRPVGWEELVLQRLGLAWQTARSDRRHWPALARPLAAFAQDL